MQTALTSVLFSIIAGPFVIRYNHAIATRLAGLQKLRPDETPPPSVNPAADTHLRRHVIICGYGRIGQSVAHFLVEEKIPFIALDLDSVRVREAHLAGEPVFYGDASERDILEAVGLEHARLVVISHDDLQAALKILGQLRSLRPELPVMVRTRDESHVEELQAAGALEVVPETLEAGLMIASQALLLLDIPMSRVTQRIQEQRTGRYRLMREFFRGDALSESQEQRDDHRLRSIVIPADSRAVGKKLNEIELDGVTVTALVRKGNRRSNPSMDMELKENDIVVVFGLLDNLEKAERLLI